MPSQIPSLATFFQIPASSSSFSRVSWTFSMAVPKISNSFSTRVQAMYGSKIPKKEKKKTFLCPYLWFTFSLSQGEENNKEKISR